MNGTDLATKLLRDLEFMKHYESGTFWHKHLSREEMSEIFSWEQLNASLSFNRITNDRFRLSTEHGHEVANRRAFRPVKDRFGRRTDYLVINELHKLMQEGVTAVLEAVNELSVNVSDLTEILGGELGAQSTANAYISFGDTSGFGAHNDDHDVVVLQLDGRKKWRFFRSPGRSGIATVNDLGAPTPADIGEEIIVTAGDVMFVPKGTWHDVVALNEKSLHLTISMVYPTVRDFIVWGLEQNRLGLPFTDLKPTSADRKQIAKSCKSYFGELFDEKNLDVFLRSFYASRASSRIRAGFPLLNSASPEAGFRRTPFDVITIEAGEANERRETFALGRIHSLTLAEHKLLTELPHVGAMSGQEIADLGGGWGTVAPILNSLMDRGLVGTVRPGV